MMYYFRQIGSDHIQGPLSLAKIRHRMPDLIDKEPTEVTESKGQSLETLLLESKWIPFRRAVEAEHAKMESPAFLAAGEAAIYEKQRGRIRFLSALALITLIVYQLSSVVIKLAAFHDIDGEFLNARGFRILFDAFFIGTLLAFFIIAVKYIALASIATAQRQK
jgi:hypothetical protein